MSDSTEQVNFYQAYKAARIERYREYAANAARRSNAAYQATHRIADGIPFGQPILVGHHSEKRHRADIARMDRGMRRSIDEGKKAAYWADRAASAESNTAISSRDPDAILLLKAKLAAMEAKQARMKAVNATHKKYLKNPAVLDSSPLPEYDKATIRIYKPAYSWEPHPYPPYRMTNNNANIRRVKERIADLERRAATPAAEDIELAGGITITEDADRDSINIDFPSKPSEEVRTKLKSFGFRWAHSEGVWYARRSNRAKYALGELFPELKTT